MSRICTIYVRSVWEGKAKGRKEEENDPPPCVEPTPEVKYASGTQR